MLRTTSHRAPLARLFALCLVCAAGSVHGDDGDNHTPLATPPLTLGTSLACVAANVGTKQATLDIEMHDTDGTVIASQRCTLPPGAINFGGTQCAVLQAAPLPGRVGYCTFTVLQGQKKYIRAAIMSHNSNQGLGNVPAALAAE